MQVLEQLNVFANEDIDAAAEALNDVSLYSNKVYVLYLGFLMPISYYGEQKIIKYPPLCFTWYFSREIGNSKKINCFDTYCLCSIFFLDAHQEALYVDRDGSSGRDRRIC